MAKSAQADLLTYDDVAALAQVSVDTIKREVRDGKIDIVKVRNLNRIRRAEYERWVEAQTVDTSASPRPIGVSKVPPAPSRRRNAQAEHDAAVAELEAMLQEVRSPKNKQPDYEARLREMAQGGRKKKT
jgi:excisionase family DNA binding protein